MRGTALPFPAGRFAADATSVPSSSSRPLFFALTIAPSSAIARVDRTQVLPEMLPKVGFLRAAFFLLSCEFCVSCAYPADAPCQPSWYPGYCSSGSNRALGNSNRGWRGDTSCLQPQEPDRMFAASLPQRVGTSRLDRRPTGRSCSRVLCTIQQPARVDDSEASTSTSPKPPSSRWKASTTSIHAGTRESRNLVDFGRVLVFCRMLSRFCPPIPSRGEKWPRLSLGLSHDAGVYDVDVSLQEQRRAHRVPGAFRVAPLPPGDTSLLKHKRRACRRGSTPASNTADTAIPPPEQWRRR